MLKRKQFYIIAICVGLLLAGLVTVQLYWIKNAYRLREISFDEQVKRLVEDAAAQAHDLAFSFYLYGRSYISAGEGVMMLKKEHITGRITDTVSLFNVFPYNNAANDTCFYSTNISYYDRLTLVDVSMKFQYKLQDSTLNVPVKNSEFKEMSLANFRTRLADSTRLREKLSLAKFDSVFTQLQARHGLTGASAYGLRKKGVEQFEYISDTAYLPMLVKSQSRKLLFTDAIFATPYELVVYISNKDHVVSGSLSAALASSVLIILLLASAFIYFIHTVLRQKKLSEMKTDFINNMTHEFMTPVTNISLALETLHKNYDEQVLEVIDEENDLLKNNINKILQVATLEAGKYRLDISETDVHEILHRVARTFSQQVKEAGGQFSFNFRAKHPVVRADETHLINLFYNLVDNAIKYSGDKPPEISIGSSNEKNMLIVTLTDKGIGMNKTLTRMAFEKFYRGQKGARHDVKGFGLGLTYVKSIADAHGLEIDVTSEPGSGTEFIITFKQ